jgi:hypothetical protein
MRQLGASNLSWLRSLDLNLRTPVVCLFVTAHCRMHMARRSGGGVAESPPIARQYRRFVGEFVVSVPFAHDRAISLSHLPFLREG